MCREMEGHSSAFSFQTITMVGAVCEEGGLSEGDRDWLEIAILQCREIGIPVSPDFTATLLNIHNGADQDFLNPRLTVPADLLLVCSVFHALQYDRNCTGRVQVSPFHCKKGVWHEAAKRSGAKIIIPLGDYVAIGVDDFAPERPGEESAYRIVRGPDHDYLIDKNFLRQQRQQLLVSL